MVQLGQNATVLRTGPSASGKRRPAVRRPIIRLNRIAASSTPQLMWTERTSVLGAPLGNQSMV